VASGSASTSRVAHLEQNMAVGDLTLSADDIAELEASDER
jgi:aryl-alcohol dehydrogenase-like predicted oxidoreductase